MSLIEDRLTQRLADFVHHRLRFRVQLRCHQADRHADHDEAQVIDVSQRHPAGPRVKQPGFSADKAADQAAAWSRDCFHWREKNAGWGGRDRTCESRDQNPLPYHLATPQSSATRTYRITCPLCNARLRIFENESPPQPSLRSRINRPNNRNCEICRPGFRRGRLKHAMPSGRPFFHSCSPET